MIPEESVEEVWSRLALFQSRDVLERRYKARHGGELSAGKADEIIAHLQQARQYFHISPLDFLTGAQEAAAFVDKQFVKLHQSTLRKVDVLANIADRAHRRDLVTLASWWGQNGQSIKRCIEWFKEHWLISGLSVAVSVTGIVLKIFKFF